MPMLPLCYELYQIYIFSDTHTLLKNINNGSRNDVQVTDWKGYLDFVYFMKQLTETKVYPVVFIRTDS